MKKRAQESTSDMQINYAIQMDVYTSFLKV